MPVHEGKDIKGCYYQWGNSGKKYYYSDNMSKQFAFKRAEKQGQAIYANGWRGH